MSDALIRAERLRKSFRIPSVRRETVREHVLGLFRRRRFDELSVLESVSFEVRRGETLGLMGRNGSGKSTLLKIVSGIYVPDAGTIEVRASVTPILELGVGWNPELDAVDNVLLAGSILGVPLARLRAEVDEILAFAELTRFAALPLRHYSSGMAARLAYAVAFHAARELLLLDEVFAVGDAAFRQRCERRYHELHDSGRTLVLVSHDPGTVERFCDRALLLEGGRIVEDGHPARIAGAYGRLLGGPAPTAVLTSPVPTGPPPKVSVLIPCFNLGWYLDEAVQSVLAQTYADTEILVVDDGSTDAETRALLADYRRPRTRVIGGPHRGLAAARNLALEEARGEYVCALDADDALEPTYLEKAVTALDADPGLTFVSCWLRTFGEEEWTWRQDRCDLPALLAECTVATPALVRRQAVRAVGGWDTAMPEQGYEDWDLWISLVERGHRGAILPEVLFRYRVREGSMSASCTRGPGHAELMRYLLSKHADSYACLLFDVLLAKEGEAAELSRDNDALERKLETVLRPALEQHQRQLASLRARLEGHRGLHAERGGILEPPMDVSEAHVGKDLDRARWEAEALRDSLSWKLTRPLRAVHGWLLRFTGGL